MSGPTFRGVSIFLFFFSLVFWGPPAPPESMRGILRWFDSLSIPAKVLVIILAVLLCLYCVGSSAPHPSSTAAGKNPTATATDPSAATVADALPTPAPRNGASSAQPRPSMVANSSRHAQDDRAIKDARTYAYISSLNAQVASLTLASTTHVAETAGLKAQLAAAQAEIARLKAALETEARRTRTALGYAKSVIDGARGPYVGEPQEDRYMHSLPRRTPQPEVVQDCDDQARPPTARSTPLSTTPNSGTSIQPLLLPHDHKRANDPVVTAGLAPNPREG